MDITDVTHEPAGLSATNVSSKHSSTHKNTPLFENNGVFWLPERMRLPRFELFQELSGRRGKAGMPMLFQNTV